jgi:hypothetical protein
MASLLPWRLRLGARIAPGIERLLRVVLPPSGQVPG